MDQIMQIVGAVLILAAYTLSQLHRLDSDSHPYLWLNFIGSLILGILAALGRQWGFLLLEGVWALVSVIGIAAKLRNGKGKTAP